MSDDDVDPEKGFPVGIRRGGAERRGGVAGRVGEHHWTSMQVRWHGYSYAAASSMCSAMAEPEQATAA